MLHALTKLIAHPSVLSADCLSPDDQAETDARRLPCHSVFVTYGFHARFRHGGPWVVLEVGPVARSGPPLERRRCHDAIGIRGTTMSSGPSGTATASWLQPQIEQTLRSGSLYPSLPCRTR